MWPSGLLGLATVLKLAVNGCRHLAIGPPSYCEPAIAVLTHAQTQHRLGVLVVGTDGLIRTQTPDGLCSCIAATGQRLLWETPKASLLHRVIRQQMSSVQYSSIRIIGTPDAMTRLLLRG